MRSDMSNPHRGFSPKALLHLLLIAGLAAFTVALIRQQMLIAIAIASLPVGMAIIGRGLVAPRFVYMLYATYAFFFTAISRYTHVNQLSAGLDALLCYGLIALLITHYHKKGSIDWKCAINVLTISYIPWVFFTLLQLSNPGTHSGGLMLGIRVWIFRSLVLYVFVSLLSNTPKALRIGLDLIGVFTLLAFIKLLWQKYIGFDSAELYWLYVEGGAVTHIIFSGIRYFSYFSDAANFGSFMAAAGLVYGIVGFQASGWRRKIWYVAIAASGILGMFISGTRGAMIIPFAGLALYCLLCKNFKILLACGLLGILMYSFFAFTYIGNGNEYIRRARTAFTGTKDASMNVRQQNRQEIAQYIATHPFGVGIENNIPKMWMNTDGTYTMGTIPPDSFFVYIWIQTGYGGLILYLLICAVVVIDGSRIVLFKIRDKQLRHTLAAFTCATLGIWASGYSGNNPGMPPTDFLLPAMMAFVMNGATIDRQLRTPNQSITLRKPLAI